MKKFRPIKKEKELISIRIEENLLKEVDFLASKFDVSRNEFIIQSIQFALHNLDDMNYDEKDMTEK